jgi:hypothetical protein
MQHEARKTIFPVGFHVIDTGLIDPVLLRTHKSLSALGAWAL